MMEVAARPDHEPCAKGTIRVVQGRVCAGLSEHTK